MSPTKVVANRVSDCSGCDLHKPGECKVRKCMKCGEPCWVDRRGMMLIVDLGALVLCTECLETPGVILLVTEADFSRAVEEAKRHRDVQRRRLAMN